MKDPFFKEEKKKTKKSLCEKCKLKNKSEKLYYNGKSDILVILDYYKQNFSFIKTKLKVPYTLTFALQCENINKITDNQINCCRENLQKVIQEIKPKKIITFGLYALKSLIGHKASVTKIKQWIGWKIPDQEYQCFIYPNLYLDSDDDVVLAKRFNNYLNAAIEDNRRFRYYSDYQNNIFILKNKTRIINFLNTIDDNDIIAFDYETNSLRSQYKNSKIICVSICKNNKSYAFMINNDEDIIYELKRIFENENIKKIAHNINFENSWTSNIFKVKINNWYWDTMICAHVLDNRSGITGLKKQIYIHFGILGYDDEVKNYIRSDSNYNNIENIESDKLLLYCGIDSYFTYLLYRIQKIKIDTDIHLKKGFEFYMWGLSNLLDVHLNGIKFDNIIYEKNYNYLTKEINDLHRKIMNSKEVNLLEDKNNFNYNSTTQLRKLLFNVCKWESLSKTITGLQSVNVTALKKFNRKLTNNILQERKLAKIRDTYLQQFKREEIEGFLYPIFNLHTVSSYRPSTSSPNMANIPKRDDLAKKLVRETIIAKNDDIVEIDYSGIEVMVAACYTKDKVLIDYINNKDSDMHRDVASEIFCIKKEEVTKELRYLAKNKFVFPQFYGDYYVNCCDNIWESLTNDQLDLLKTKGFKNKSLFKEHLKRVEFIFWNKRFKEYNEWRKDNWNFYLKNGYINYKTGFRSICIMRRNQANNLAFQGSAFMILLWSLSNINEFLKKNKYKTHIINQVYDCVVFDRKKEEWKELRPIIKKIMLEDVRKYFEWIIIPLKAEITYYGKNWSDEIKSEML